MSWTFAVHCFSRLYITVYCKQEKSYIFQHGGSTYVCYNIAVAQMCIRKIEFSVKKFQFSAKKFQFSVEKFLNLVRKTIKLMRKKFNLVPKNL